MYDVISKRDPRSYWYFGLGIEGGGLTLAENEKGRCDIDSAVERVEADEFQAQRLQSPVNVSEGITCKRMCVHLTLLVAYNNQDAVGNFCDLRCMIVGVVPMCDQRAQGSSSDGIPLG